MSKNYFILDKKYSDLLEKLGLNTQEVLKKAQLPQDLLNRKSPVMTIEEYIRFMESIKELSKNDSNSARVRSSLIELLPAGEGSIDNVASKLGLSKRTLQRKLKEEDTTFQKQLNHIRELLARHYLKNSDMTSDDIAYLLGYQDLNSFVRAFNVWTGMTVSEYKRGLI